MPDEIRSEPDIAKSNAEQSERLRWMTRCEELGLPLGDWRRLRDEHGSRVPPSGDAGVSHPGGVFQHSAATSPEPSDHARRAAEGPAMDIYVAVLRQGHGGISNAQHIAITNTIADAIDAAVREFAERVCRNLDEEDARIVREEAERA